MIPRYLINPSYAVKTYPYSDCIIIGSGIAGLSTAIRLSKHNIKVLTKSSPSDSTTWYAQGGIAAAIKKPDEWKKHYEDTLIAGQGLSDEKAVEILVKNAPRMIEKLIEIGTKFDITGGEISLTTEGGHSHPRVLHAGGDATGEEIEKKLVSFTKELEQVNFKPDYFVLDILTSGDSCIGVIGLDLSSRSIEIHPSSNVLIASGGIGQIYELSTNPPISTGDGVAMAYRA
ncbi:MAG: FAD-dependent oxidoreductase, partial [Candidatus Humimicrobiaceae bacterium]